MYKQYAWLALLDIVLAVILILQFTAHARDQASPEKTANTITRN